MTALVEPEAQVAASRQASSRVLWLVAGGMLVLQVAWVLAVPPFRGADEFDHAYRAASVARGHWNVTPTDAARGTGAWVLVPDDIVEAARPQCEGLKYTNDAECRGSEVGEHTRRVASGAGRYHPLFYAVAGIPALPFSGYTAMYVMRVMTVLMAWSLFCAALLATRSWARTAWPFVGLAVASTPVLIYSASVVAPNGVELMAALALWTSLLGLGFGPARGSDRTCLAVTTIAGAVLTTTRSLGPLWCVLIGLTALLATRPTTERWRGLLRQRLTWIGGGLVLLATLQSVWWIETKGSLKIGTVEGLHLTTGVKVHELSTDIPVWVLQSIAAFPLRDERSPTVLYACYLALFLTILALGLRAAGRTVRWTIVASLVVAIAVPTAISFATYDQHPGSWQGRYGLPYALGIALLCTAALDRANASIGPRLRVTVALLFVAGQIVGPASVLQRSLGSRHVALDSFVHLPVVADATLAGLGALMLIAAVGPSHTGDRAEAP